MGQMEEGRHKVNARKVDSIYILVYFKKYYHIIGC